MLSDVMKTGRIQHGGNFLPSDVDRRARGIRGLQKVLPSCANFLEKRGVEPPFGGVAQAGERCVCNAQVSGSSPLTSIPRGAR